MQNLLKLSSLICQEEKSIETFPSGRLWSQIDKQMTYLLNPTQNLKGKKDSQNNYFRHKTLNKDIQSSHQHFHSQFKGDRQPKKENKSPNLIGFTEIKLKPSQIVANKTLNHVDLILDDKILIKEKFNFRHKWQFHLLEKKNNDQINKESICIKKRKSNSKCLFLNKENNGINRMKRSNSEQINCNVKPISCFFTKLLFREKTNIVYEQYKKKQRQKAQRIQQVIKRPAKRLNIHTTKSEKLNPIVELQEKHLNIFLFDMNQNSNQKLKTKVKRTF